MKPLIVIPARGGSKGVPRKNIKVLGDKPLIQYTIDAAKGVFDDEFICVSTDDFEIKSVVEQLGLKVPFLRPNELASDTAGTYEVLLHAISHYESEGYFPDTLILLQPTSPFRTSKHIQAALDLYQEELDMVVGVKETKSNPYYILFEEDSNGYLKKSKEADFTRRQDCPKVWEYNGAIYIINVKALKEKTISQFTKVRKFEMDETASHDIDTLLDWKIAEIIANSQEI
ncbi:acylneuraminate cytidylyltransferase family protein [Flavobacterium sp.]|uniref:acylneuraminate cytidylyltransferase family protein n=1 Tax=Flavobacterium sp. TaxID=239 RepID=UPI0025B7E509|nr:acylneuraminate cytidylyltransferase family protein [Flavobacterium sp.]